MPSGPAHLHEKFGHDGSAWGVLRQRGFTHHHGVIALPDRPLTTEERDAIDYLVLEWDWDAQPKDTQNG